MVKLTKGEALLFTDSSIEAAFQAWAKSESDAGRTANKRQFLMRLRFIFQRNAHNDSASVH